MASPIVFNGVDDVKAAEGTHLGYSDWLEITQERVNTFAEATGDYQWIHVDVERAKAGPFGGPIAHGYLTLSLAPVLMAEVARVDGLAMAVNYGLNKLRFPSPVPVGSRVRMGASLAGLEEIPGGVQCTMDLTFEIEGQDKPACVTQAVYRYYT